MISLYKHRWNTRWAFARKLDIFTCENNMLSSHVKISLLLRLHHTSCLSHQKTIQVKWFGISLVFILWIEHYTATWIYKIFFSYWKNISLVLCTHSWNIFHHSKRNFISRHGHVISSISSCSCSNSSTQVGTQNKDSSINLQTDLTMGLVSSVAQALKKIKTLIFYKPAGTEDSFLGAPSL